MESIMDAITNMSWRMEKMEGKMTTMQVVCRRWMVEWSMWRVDLTLILPLDKLLFVFLNK